MLAFFLPAIIVASVCAVLSVYYWRLKRAVSWTSLATLVIMALKLLLVWVTEPIFVLVPPVGYAIRSLTMPLLLPEAFFIPLFYDKIKFHQVSWPLLLSAMIPFGSAVLAIAGARLVALIKKKP